MKSIIRVMWIVSVLLVISLQVGVAQESTPEPEDAGTLFIGEDCTRHCWFDLLTNDSTSEDVYEWLLTSENVSRVDGMAIDEYMIEGERDSDTNILVDGQYDFILRPFPVLTDYQVTHGSITSSGLSIVEIKNGVISESIIILFDYITISEVLETLGQPDQIRFTYDGYSASASLQFIYIERRLRVNFTNFYIEPPVDGSFDCDILNFLDGSIVSSIQYFSTEVALETPYSSEPDIPQLIYYGFFRYAPLDVWESWLATDETISCREAYEALPTERVYPDLSVLEAMLDSTPAP